MKEHKHDKEECIKYINKLKLNLLYINVKQQIFALVWKIIFGLKMNLYHKDQAFGAFQDAFDYVCSYSKDNRGGKY